jgi:hypothetical protein
MRDTGAIWVDPAPLPDPDGPLLRENRISADHHSPRSVHNSVHIPYVQVYRQLMNRATPSARKSAGSAVTSPYCVVASVASTAPRLPGPARSTWVAQ